MQNSDNFKRPLTVSMNGNWKLKGPFKKVVCMHALHCIMNSKSMKYYIITQQQTGLEQ